jgi:hypothetical protein
MGGLSGPIPCHLKACAGDKTSSPAIRAAGRKPDRSDHYPLVARSTDAIRQRFFVSSYPDPGKKEISLAITDIFNRWGCPDVYKVGHCIDMQKKTQPIPTGFFNINAWQ